MKELSTITIMRKWNHPQILITVNNELIELKMTMTDFQRIMTEEIRNRLRTELAAAIGSVTWTFREDTFRQKAGDAIDATVPDVIANAITVALEAIKSESSKVMGGQ